MNLHDKVPGLDEPQVGQTPFRLWIFERPTKLKVKVTDQRWDELRHFKKRDVSSQACPRPHSELRDHQM